MALVIGGEGKGMRQLVSKKCDFSISIPMQGGLDSLNASVAGAVVLFEIMRQRRIVK
jgi:23S rRNA (guanosine2251-2'-O)-methyltransferase